MAIRFTVPETPVAKGRARHAGNRTYTPAKTVAYERRVRAACQDAMRRHGWGPLEGALRMEVIFRMPVPKSGSKKRRASMLSGEIRPTSRPDCSNLLKAIEDAINLIAYADDSQIVELVTKKFYAETTGSDVLVQRITSERAAQDQGD